MVGGVPLELLAGPCLEVWQPPGAVPVQALSRYGAARRDWLLAQGVHPQDRARVSSELRSSARTCPWSHAYVLRERGAGYLADLMARLGLPADWSPVYVAGWDYGPPLGRAAWPDYKIWRDRAPERTDQ